MEVISLMDGNRDYRFKEKLLARNGYTLFCPYYTVRGSTMARENNATTGVLRNGPVTASITRLYTGLSP